MVSTFFYAEPGGGPGGNTDPVFLMSSATFHSGTDDRLYAVVKDTSTGFIYAVVAEEMGFIGAFLVLAMFVVLAVVGVRIAQHAPDRFGMLTAMGIAVWLTLQAVVNIGAVVGVLPITGVTLPFVSFGGTSLLVGMAAVGVLLNIGRQGSA